MSRSLWSRPQVKVGVVILFVLAMLVILRVEGRLSWFVALNRTPSIPLGLYATRVLPAGEVPPYGSVVCFRYSPPDWAEQRQYTAKGNHICKYLLAKAGDILHEQDGEWRAIGADGVTRIIGRMSGTDSAGRSLPGTLQEGVVEQHHVVIASPLLERSLDSRYLGPIPVRALSMQQYPLVVWGGPGK